MCNPVSRRAIMTLEGGHKVMVTLSITNPSMLRFPKETEVRLVREWNKTQPNTAPKAVSIHILRN